MFGVEKVGGGRGLGVGKVGGAPVLGGLVGDEEVGVGG